MGWESHCPGAPRCTWAQLFQSLEAFEVTHCQSLRRSSSAPRFGHFHVLLARKLLAEALRAGTLLVSRGEGGALIALPPTTAFF